MSLQLIQEYHHKVQEILQYGGSRNETAIRPAFQKLLELRSAVNSGHQIFHATSRFS